LTRSPGLDARGLRRSVIYTIVAACCGSILAFAAVVLVHSPVPRPSGSVQSQASLDELLSMSPDQLGSLDIALVNLRCALDSWAGHVKAETARHLYRVNDPNYAEHYKHSESRFRAEMLVQILQEDCKVHYNTARINEPDFRNSKDLFINGMIDDDNGGTCASMPVLYVAVGRRLGYPLKLVQTKAHLFVRWENAATNERFNIEATASGGMDSYPDDYYRRWPLKRTDAERREGVYLHSLSPAEELAVFMASRGDCLDANGRLNEAQIAYSQAHRLAPRFTPYFVALATAVGREIPAGAQSVGRTAPQNRPSVANDTWLRDADAVNRRSRELMETQFRPAVAPSADEPRGVAGNPPVP
jgi:hypothetical protein